AAALVETLARAVQHAHERGVVHRDLKPANILLSAECGVRNAEFNQESRTPHSAFRTPKITAFALAKKLDDDSGQTHPRPMLGTPSYMAAEQAEGRGRDVGPDVDVYALGAILYECLTGRPPSRAPRSSKRSTRCGARSRSPCGSFSRASPVIWRRS